MDNKQNIKGNLPGKVIELTIIRRIQDLEVKIFLYVSVARKRTKDKYQKVAETFFSTWRTPFS